MSRNKSCFQDCRPDNPCSCLQTKKIKPPKPCHKPDGKGGDKCCLKACNALITCKDSVGPCGAVGIFDLTTLEHITSGCGGEILYSKVEYDTEIFADVKISKNGELTWTTKGPNTVGKFGMVCFKIQCESNCDDCVTLSSIGYINIGVNNLCRGVVCEECDTCDPCTGECIHNETDVEIVSDNENANCPDGHC